MREIKFRAFSDKQNRYIDMYWDFDIVDGILKQVPRSAISDKKIAAIEQYTGLKDKNGVEIYEGDVISASVFGFRETGIVEYSPFGEWVFGNIRLNEFMSSLEVIGNIHENADLLVDDTDLISPDDIGNDIQ